MFMPNKHNSDSKLLFPIKKMPASFIHLEVEYNSLGLGQISNIGIFLVLWDAR